MEKDIIDTYSNHTSRVSKQWGLGEPAGRIWGVLLCHKASLTQKEIAKKCRYSLSLVSSNLTLLKKMNIIQAVGSRGKEKVYSPTTSFTEGLWSMLRNFNESEINPIIRMLKNRLKIEKNSDVKDNMSRLMKEYTRVQEILNSLSSRLKNLRKTTG